MCSPQPKVEWYHKDRLLQFANKSRHQWTSDNQVLDINPVLIEDEGDYVCKAFNTLGSTTTEMRLQVSGESLTLFIIIMKHTSCVTVSCYVSHDIYVILVL